MKNIISSVLGFLLLFSFTTQTFEASNPSISIEGASTTIHLTKSAWDNTIDRIELEENEFLVGKKYLLLSLEATINYNKPHFSSNLSLYGLAASSSNESIFTIDDNHLIGHSEGTAFLQFDLNGQPYSVEIKIVEADPLDNITFVLPSVVGSDSVRGMWVSAGKFYNTHNGILDNYNSETRELTLSGIDWSLDGGYIGHFSIGNRIFKIEFDQEDKGKTIELSFNEHDYTAVTFDIPSSEKLKIKHITIGATRSDTTINGHLYDLDEKYNYIVYIPKDTYGIQLIAEGETALYNLFTEKLDLTKPTETVRFNEHDLVKITFDTDVNQTLLSLNYLCDFTNINGCSPAFLDNKFETIVAKKSNNYSFRFYIGDRKGWEYLLAVPDFTLINDRTIQTGNAFTTELKFDQPSYKEGEKINFNRNGTVLKVADQFGNELTSIELNNKKTLGTLTFTNGSEVYKVPVEGYGIEYSRVVLPNAEGTFTVTYSIGEELENDRTKPNVSGNWKTWPGTTRVVNEQHDWTISFNSAVNAKILNNKDIFVVDEEGYLVEGVKLERSTDGEQVYVKAPSTGYTTGSYTLYINNTIQSTSNKQLARKIKMSFNVK